MLKINIIFFFIENKWYNKIKENKRYKWIKDINE